MHMAIIWDITRRWLVWVRKKLSKRAKSDVMCTRCCSFLGCSLFFCSLPPGGFFFWLRDVLLKSLKANLLPYLPFSCAQREIFGRFSKPGNEPRPDFRTTKPAQSKSWNGHFELLSSFERFDRNKLFGTFFSTFPIGHADLYIYTFYARQSPFDHVSDRS